MEELKKEFPANIDWPLLRQQKIALLKLMDNENQEGVPTDEIIGIINLLDALQDYASDVLMIEGVFPDDDLVPDETQPPAESQADIETMEDQTEPDQNPEQTITISQADLAILTGRPKPITVFGAYQHFLYYFDQALYEKEQPNGGLTRHFLDKLTGLQRRHNDYNSIEVLVRWVQEMTRHNQEDLLSWILKHHSNK
jgi:hypothetical protein